MLATVVGADVKCLSLRLTEKIARLEFAPVRVLRQLELDVNMIDGGTFLPLQRRSLGERSNDLTWRSQCWL